MDVGYRIDELAEQMACIPFNADILVLAFVEEPLPDRRLPQHVVVHDRQMKRPLGAMLESQSHSSLGRELRNRFPKRNQLRNELVERLIDRIAAALMCFHLYHGSGKPGDRPYSDMRRDLDGPLKGRSRELALFRIERISVKGADG